MASHSHKINSVEVRNEPRVFKRAPVQQRYGCLDSVDVRHQPAKTHVRPR